MFMYNRVILVGHLTRDVEIRYSQSGSAIAKVGIASTKKWKNQSTGQMSEKTMFVDITGFGRTGEVMNQYCKKGSKVLVEGSLEFEQWVAQDGTKRSKHSVLIDKLVMLDTKSLSQQQSYSQPQQQSYSQPPVQNQPQQQSYSQPPQQQGQEPANPTVPDIPEIDIDDDEIPF